MRSTVRFVLVLFLVVLILSNYNSIRVLHHAIQYLDLQLQEQSASVLSQVSADLNHRAWTADPKDTGLRPFLSNCIRKYGLKGIVLYGSGEHPRAAVLTDAPADLSDPKRILGSQSAARRDAWLMIEGSYREGTMSLPVVLIVDARRAFQIERTTKIVSYTNILLMVFAGLMVLYFFESAFRSYKALMQTARSAPLSVTATENRNEADFLIGTFNGVISRLKMKEQELEKLHQSEKARADDVQQLNQDLVRSISSGLILVDDQGCVRVFNEAAEAILELDRSTVLTQPYEKALTGAASGLRIDIARCFQDREHLERAEMELKTAGGKQ
ncbi:MAG TPA: PAS domain-containing protein, partial [Acidobacteriota bacterium]|nr:PAS domain-containing protein [Acidobacteriota bacterium]